MSGSRRYFEYAADNGLGYMVQLDESNAELAGAGFEQISAATKNSGRFLKVSSTRPIEMRHLLLVGVDAGNKDVRRKLYVGDAEATLWQGTQTQVTLEGELFAITAYIGEKRFVIPDTDTEQDDGDVDSNIEVIAG